MRIPKFKSIEEEAEFRDNTDTSDILLNARKRMIKRARKSKPINEKGSNIGDLARNRGEHKT